MDLDLQERNILLSAAGEKLPVFQNSDLQNSEHFGSLLGATVKSATSTVKTRYVGNIAQHPNFKVKPTDVL